MTPDQVDTAVGYAALVFVVLCLTAVVTLAALVAFAGPAGDNHPPTTQEPTP